VNAPATIRGPSALAALRAATRPLHDEIEARMVLSREHAGANEYRLYASALYGWMAEWETALWQAPWPTEVEAAQRDNKRAWLQADLAALGMELPPSRAHPPALDSLAARFGVAYVIEGSQLGGAVLARRLALPTEPRYLIGYGAALGPRWKSFLAALENNVVASADIECAASTAHDTFASLTHWLTTHGAA
jgi:heme oxygenase